MNKRSIIEAVAEGAGITKAAATRALESFLKTVRSSLVKGEKVTLAGFGTFAVSRRKARRVRDPRRGTPMQIDARRVARFAPGLELKTAIEKAALVEDKSTARR